MTSRAPFVVVLAVATAITTAKGTAEIVYPPYLAGYGYSLTIIGFLTSLFAVMQLASRVPVGVAYRTDRAKRQYAIALAAFGATTSLFAFADGQAVPVLALSVLHGFAFGALGTLGLALAIDVTTTGGATPPREPPHRSVPPGEPPHRSAPPGEPPHRSVPPGEPAHGSVRPPRTPRTVGAAMAWYTAAISTGYALGSLLGGWLADAIGIPATFGLAGMLPILAALAILALPRLEGAPLEHDRGKGLAGLLRAGLRLDSRVWLAVVIVIYINLLWDALDTFFPVFAPTIGMSLAVVGVLRALKSGAGIFIRFAVVVLLDIVDYRVLTAVAVFAAAAGMLVLPLTTAVAVMVPIFVVLGFARGVLRVTSAATIAELRREGRDVGLASGVYNAGLDIGSIVGPIVGGAVASAFGIGPMFQLVAAGSLLAWLAVALSTPATREASGLGKRHTIGPRDIPGGERIG